MGRLDNNIEGSTPLEEQLEGLLIPHINTVDDLNRVEHANITKATAYYFLDTTKIINFKLNLDNLYKVHKQMFDEVWGWAGIKRSKETAPIGVSVFRIDEELKKIIDDCNYWIEHKTYKPIEIAARLHYKLVFIHPFKNGNGRWSRLVGMIIFYQLTKSYLIWPSDLNKETTFRKDYLIALHKADNGNLKPMISLHEKIYSESLE